MAEGVKERAPEVEAEGKTLFQRLNEQFRQGIFVPIHFMPGEGMGGGAGGLIQKASFGNGDLGGLVQRAGLGGGGVGSGIGTGGGGGGGLSLRRGDSSGGGGPSGLIPTIPSSVQMTAAERNELGLITKYEAGGRNVPNYINDRRHTAQGYYQITNTNWRRIAPQLGITAPNAMSASLEDQTRVALHLRRASGLGNWTRYNPRLRGALARGEQVPAGAVATKDAAGLEPKLVKGLDGKEGLDLGDGTMRMPNGAVRSIPRGSSLEIPDAPAGGLGGIGSGGRGLGELREHIAELGRHIDRFGESSMHAQVEVTGLHKAGLRATAIRVRSHGGLRGDMGITEMGAKLNAGDPADWNT